MPNSNDIRGKLEGMFREQDRIAVFVDSYHTSLSAKNIDLKIDWDKVVNLFRDLSRIAVLNFYVSSSTDQNFRAQSTDWKPLAIWLTHNGYVVEIAEGGYSYEFKVTNPKDPDNPYKNWGYKTNYDSKMILDMMTCADRVDKVVLFSSNSDFCPVVKYLQAKGIPVVVISNSLNRLKNMHKNGEIKNVGTIGVELIRSANEFIELSDLQSEIFSDKNDVLSE